MKNIDTPRHVRGESLFLDDISAPDGLLHASIFTSPVARGNIAKIECSDARNGDGVVAVFTSEDIPGENQIGAINPDEPLFAAKEVHYVGQPIAMVVARHREQARRAVSLIRLDIDTLEPVLDPRLSAKRGQLIAPSRMLCLGDVDAIWKTCNTVLEGAVETGAQEHLYLEPQCSMAIPHERNRLKIFSSTQAPTSVQKHASKVLALPMNHIEVEVARLGGAFGGKEDQATPWAVMTALAASCLKRPVKLVLSRHEDIRYTGKRHPYASDYKIGLDENGNILALEITLYQNAGASADLSTAILERSMFHATNGYFIPNVRVTGLSCRTNLPPFTAFRGFGAPQAIFVIESAIDHAARVLGHCASHIQSLNLLKDGDQFPYGMRVENSKARRSFKDAQRRYNYKKDVEDKNRFNAENALIKRGVSVMPICFGISFTSTFLNQAGALVHVYSDGAVSVNTGAIEMGQGVNTKILAIAAQTLGIDRDLVLIENTNTGKVANTSPTAASSGADLNGKASENACDQILSRLKKVAADKLKCKPSEIAIRDGHVFQSKKRSTLSWQELIQAAYVSRVNLSAQAHYATPGIFYDKETESGSPFAYHVFGTAITEVTLDCLRGTYSFDRVRIVHDAGESLDPLIDRGQIEGGLVQGMGWVTLEDVRYDAEGRLQTDSLSTYKIPDIYFAPKIESVFLPNAKNPKAVMSSKAIGEPPFLYGVGSFFALVDAMTAYRPDKEITYKAPMTPEQVLAFLHEEVLP